MIGLARSFVSPKPAGAFLTVSSHKCKGVLSTIIQQCLPFCLRFRFTGTASEHRLPSESGSLSVRDFHTFIGHFRHESTRRFQTIGEQMELKFPGQTIIWTLHVPPPEKITVADIQPMLDTIKARSEVVTKLRDIYITEPPRSLSTCMGRNWGMAPAKRCSI